MFVKDICVDVNFPEFTEKYQYYPNVTIDNFFAYNAIQRGMIRNVGNVILAISRHITHIIIHIKLNHSIHTPKDDFLYKHIKSAHTIYHAKHDFPYNHINFTHTISRPKHDFPTSTSWSSRQFLTPNMTFQTST